MVRHKTRHLLVRLDFEKDLRSSHEATTTVELSKKDIFRCIRETLVSSFGVAASGAANEIQVRFYDENYQLVMMRIPRDWCGKIRSALSFVTSIQGKRVVASTIAVNGSARTAKIATILEYRRRIRQEVMGDDGDNDGSSISSRLRMLEERIKAIRSMD